MEAKRHNYEYDIDTASDSAPANVVRMVGKGKRVLEIGCGPGSITKVLATSGRCSVTGLELDNEAIKKVEPFCEAIFKADLNSEEWPSLLDDLERFDVVVAADVLEHLYDPWNTLKRMVPFIKEDGYIVISLPHAGHAAIISCLIDGDFQYGDWGLLDRTHIRFFCLRNIEELFFKAGLKIVDISYVTKMPQDTEFSSQWSRLSSEAKKVLAQSPHSNIYQVVIKAVPEERVGVALSLAPNRVLKPKSDFLSLLRRYLSARLGSDSKIMIRRVLRGVGIKL
ncbi:methyltransferase domain-containing protein [Pseudomonas sp. Fl5BN2]|uniref:class I SAM-dependent methyltransferase n=1 Tax=Pseudomonas sp. Fl5BN2 TaxID=2697652 RepID=UPI001376977D|nr:class I SAM-dependent methyltransferase [Pseudomonas sp. Fl5BN2]NBF03405.1 methyltransferase domain-containing protein [Pseudomonas sp. Fl5BN2]